MPGHITTLSSPKGSGLASPAAGGQDPTLHLPRILCLHGGGTNARIFRAQCRSLRLRLSPYFRLVFADAPFLSGPGPDVESVYAEWGPFRSWMCLQPGAGRRGQGSVLDFKAIDRSIAVAMREDDQVGATGKWVGLLGFSQGARLAGCLLLRQQQQQADDACKDDDDDDYYYDDGRSWLQLERQVYQFAVLLAGRGPLQASRTALDEPSDPVLLHLPTVHVHGTRDAGLALHRNLLHCCCEKGSARLVEWDGDHRVPIKSKDVAPVVTVILDIARESGVIVK